MVNNSIIIAYFTDKNVFVRMAIINFLYFQMRK